MALIDTTWYVRGKTNVQPVWIGSSFVTAGATTTLTGVTVPAGATIVVYAFEVTSTAVGTCADGTNTYTIPTSGSVIVPNSKGIAQFFVAFNVTALTNATITFTKNVSGRSATIGVFYALGCLTASTPVDASVTVSNAYSASATPAVTCGATTTNGELLVIGSAEDGAGSVNLNAVTPSAFASLGGTASFGQGTNFAHLLVAYDSGKAADAVTLTYASAIANGALLAIGLKPLTAPSGDYWALPLWTASTAYVAGNVVQQNTIANLQNERSFVCLVAGTAAASEPTWATTTVTRGQKFTDGGVTWQECSGQPGLNGDTVNCAVWAPSITWVLGQVIYVASNGSLQICSTAGAGGTGSIPAFSATAGTTTTDVSATWTSLGLASGFAAWAVPAARLGCVTPTTWTWANNQHRILIASDHYEWSGTTTINLPSGNALPTRVQSVNPAAAPPAATQSGATIQTLGNAQMVLQQATPAGGCGTSYFYGLIFSAGQGLGTQNATMINHVNSGSTFKFEDCLFIKGNSVSAGFLTGTGGSQGLIILRNTSFQCGNIGDLIYQYPGNGRLIWEKTATPFVGSILPNIGLNISGGNSSQIYCRGVDFSAVITGNLFAVSNNTAVVSVILDRCRLQSTFTALTTVVPSVAVDLVNCDTASGTYRHERYRGTANQVCSTAVVRTGGASDGTTLLSWLIATLQEAGWTVPFESMPIAEWSSVAGATVTASLYGVVNAAVLPKNDELWMETDYFGSSSTVLAAFANNTKATDFDTGTALTADTSAWDSLATARQNSFAYSTLGTAFKLASNPGRIWFCTQTGTSAGSEPGGYATAIDGQEITDNTAKFRAGCRFVMSVAMSSPSPQVAGIIKAVIKAAKPSMTYFVDPKLSLT